MTKYHAIKTTRTLPDGSVLKFDSLAEAAYWDKESVHFGWGEQLISHPHQCFEIEGSVYHPDFRLADNHYIEVKGADTPMWRRTLKQLRERYPNLKLLIIYGRADKKRIFVTTKTEWLNP